MVCHARVRIGQPHTNTTMVDSTASIANTPVRPSAPRTGASGTIASTAPRATRTTVRNTPSCRRQRIDARVGPASIGAVGTPYGMESAIGSVPVDEVGGSSTGIASGTVAGVAIRSRGVRKLRDCDKIKPAKHFPPVNSPGRSVFWEIAQPMAKARGVDAKLTRLRGLRTETDSPSLLAELRQHLGDKSNLVVADAAEIVGARMLVDLGPELAAAFQRFMIEPVDTDKLCRAKIAIVDALHKIEFDAEDVFRAALRHVQMEPRWGGSDDTAAPLRGAAAFALVRVNPRDLLILLADLLADAEKVARSSAARALGASGALAAIPLLRLKARVGDVEPEVVAECLNALVAADAAASVPFVGQFLASSSEEIAEGAALALAESRCADALELLKQHWPKTRPGSLQNVLLLAIAITRLPAGVDFLIDILAAADESTGPAAITALAIHRHNPSVREHVGDIVAKKRDSELRKRFDKEFRSGE